MTSAALNPNGPRQLSIEKKTRQKKTKHQSQQSCKLRVKKSLECLWVTPRRAQPDWDLRAATGADRSRVGLTLSAKPETSRALGIALCDSTCKRLQRFYYPGPQTRSEPPQEEVPGDDPLTPSHHLWLPILTTESPERALREPWATTQNSKFMLSINNNCLSSLLLLLSTHLCTSLHDYSLHPKSLDCIIYTQDRGRTHFQLRSFMP